ncbi:MAG: hypothetical protein QXQ48_06740 [Nitrososphaerota archaeon]
MFHGGCRRGAWYPWALQRLGIEYEHQRPGIRNRVERLFRRGRLYSTASPAPQATHRG